MKEKKNNDTKRNQKNNMKERKIWKIKLKGLETIYKEICDCIEKQKIL